MFGVMLSWFRSLLLIQQYPGLSSSQEQIHAISILWDLRIEGLRGFRDSSAVANSHGGSLMNTNKLGDLPEDSSVCRCWMLSRRPSRLRKSPRFRHE